MARSIFLACVLAFVAGCASSPVGTKVAVSAKGPPISEEMDCMSECLESADEDCDSCVTQCLKPSSTSVLASF